METTQVDLFGEKVVVDDGRKTEIFSNNDIAEAAFKMFREKGFPYPKLEMPEMMNQLNELANLPLSKCVHSVLGYRIADTYNTHRFHVSALDMRSPFFSFNDDKSLRKVIRKHIEAGNTHIPWSYMGFFSMINGTQACSNFRPAFAKMLYNSYSEKDSRVMDFSTGFGGRLVGFLASHCGEYIGTDPNTLTYAANLKLTNDLGKHKKVVLYNEPFENLDVSEYKDSCSLSFSSPPYFKKEIYSSEPTQSCNRYPEYDNWISGFLKPMMYKNFFCVKEFGYCIVNIQDVKIKNKVYPLVQDTIRLGKEAGFAHIRNDVFMLQPRTSVKSDGRVVSDIAKEMVIIFQKLNPTKVFIPEATETEENKNPENMQTYNNTHELHFSEEQLQEFKELCYEGRKKSLWCAAPRHHRGISSSCFKAI